jgi:hypothetical protein
VDTGLTCVDLSSVVADEEDAWVEDDALSFEGLYE